VVPGDHPAPGGLATDDWSSSMSEHPLDLEGAGVPCAIMDLQTKRLIAVNNAFASLMDLDVTLAHELDFLSLLPLQPRALFDTVLSGMSAGLIDLCQGHGPIDLPAEGEVPVSGWLRRLPGNRALLAMVSAGPHRAGDDGGATTFGYPILAGPHVDRLVLGAIDHEWRLCDISPDATVWFGWNLDEYRGRQLQSVVHPDDAPSLLLALGRSGVERRGVATVVRVGTHDGGWVHVHIEMSPLCDHNPPRFALALWVLDTERDAEPPDQRAARLEDHLWRIALEIAAAGIGDSPATGEMWWGDPALRELSQRQLDILRRLLRGERVPTIAQDLFLSQSTVRNHLSAIYRRLGVHSQAELLARLLPSRPSLTPEEV
jgi:PAS domain S-box-containing protein